MLRLAADEDLDHRIVRGVRQRNPAVDLVRVQEAGLSGESDPAVLGWAAEEGRVLFTHDVNTMIAHARRRAGDREPMPWLFAIPRNVPVAAAIEDVLLIAECSLPGEHEGLVDYIPLR